MDPTSGTASRDPDLLGVLQQLRDGKVQLARALLAVRRADRLGAETHLNNAQRAIAAAEIDVAEEVAPRVRK